MQASDIMSTAVFSVRPDMPVKDIAALLFEKRISGVPVLDEGRLVGIVSEGDLLQRHEIGTDLAAGGIQCNRDRWASCMVLARSISTMNGTPRVEDHRVPFHRIAAWE